MATNQNQHEASAEEPPKLVSFGFLREDDKDHPTAYGIGQLFSRVKTALGASSVPAEPPLPSSSATSSSHSTSEQVNASLEPLRRPRTSSAADVAIQLPLAKASAEAPNRTLTATPALEASSFRPAQAVRHPDDRPSLLSLTSIKSSKLSSRQRPTSVLRTIAPAPALTSVAAAHALAQQSSVPEEAGDTVSKADSNGDAVITTSGTSRNPLLESIRPTAIVPGFPLSADLLADDAQSVYSEQTYVLSGSPSTSNLGNSASTSLQMSAEAFRRLNAKGGTAQSKEWWMPDESAKECTSCGSVFSLARRKHHCRCCGQIFCARCAANLVPGSRLGLSGTVRTCNFCAKMLREYARAEQQPKAEWNRVRADMISAPLEAVVENAPQGRFAANALFSSALSKGMPALSRTSSLTDLASPIVGMDDEHAEEAPMLPGQAPFRKGLVEEDQIVTPDGTADDESSVVPAEDVDSVILDTPTALPSPMADDTLDSILPSEATVAARNVLDSARAKLLNDSGTSQDPRARLINDAAIKAFRRSRLRSRMNEFSEKPPVTLGFSQDNPSESNRPRSRLGSGGGQQLEPLSLLHLRCLLQQTLAKSEVPELQHWQEILLPLILKVIQNIRPKISGQGKMMGIRRYVKIKRIPGGQPQESHVMDGYVCSHNVASKAMIRRLPLQSARVALIGFPLTAVKGDGQYVSLEALSASEREFTRILVARVLALRPHLLIVRDQVSRLALEMLEHAGVVVVWKVPDSSMAAISRVTQSDVITSVDRLALQPRLGRCGTFAVDTYHSTLLPGKRRSFLNFTGTPKELGCSVVLRGGSHEQLGRVKVILEFCLLAAHNLRLEESMRVVSVSLLPEPSRVHQHQDLASEIGGVETENDTTDSAGLLKDYETTLLSISRTLHIPPPHSLIQLHHEQLELARLPDKGPQTDAECTVGDLENQSSPHEKQAGALEGDVTPVQEKSEILPSLDDAMDVEEQVRKVLPSDEAMTVQTKRAMAQSRASLASGFVRHIDTASAMSPFTHQRLVYLHSVISSATRRPCLGPRVEQLDFYGSGDRTISDYLESKCADNSQLCKAKSCGLQQILHYESYIHNDVRLQCFCERFVCPIAGQEGSILTWEYCKSCEAATPVSVVNDDAKAYSWGKFIEAHFYTQEAVSSCPHKSLRDRIRYFAYKNLAFRIHVESIHSFEIVIPGLRLSTRPDSQNAVKKDESLGLARRADGYFHSVDARLKVLEHEICLGREGVTAVEKYRAKLDEIRDMALAGRQEVNALLVSEVKNSPPQDTLCLNKVRRRLQDIVVKLDKLFLQLEKAALPKERDMRRLTANHLSRLFAERDPSETRINENSSEPASLAPSSGLEERIAEGLPGDQTPSSMSVLASVADAAALGLPPSLGMPFGSLSPAASQSAATSQTATAVPSRAPSAQSSTNTSQVPTPVQAPSSPEAPNRTRESTNASEPLSSPTIAFQPPPRPRPRKSKQTPSNSGSNSPVVKATDSSCTEAGDTTDAQTSSASSWKALGGGRFRGLTPANTSPVERNFNIRPPLNHAATASGTIPKSTDDGPLRPVQLSQPNRRDSKSPEVGANRPAATRAQSASALTVTRERALAARGGPPSSYRPPNMSRKAARTSESESDAPNIRGGLRLARRGSGRSTPVSEHRPGFSRRVSNTKSDSGNEAAQQQSHPHHHRRPPMPQGSSQAPSRVPVPSMNTRGRVNTIARQFDRINREAERERERQRRAMAVRARRALPIASSSARIAEYTSVTAAVESDESSEDDDDDDEEGNDDESQGEYDDEADADSEAEATEHDGDVAMSLGSLTEDKAAARAKGIADGLAGKEPATQKKVSDEIVSKIPSLDKAVAAVEKFLPELRDQALPSSIGESAGDTKGSLLKTISSFWATRSGTSLPLLEYPLSAEQHLFADSALLLREDEPSSTIAFTLVSTKYQDRMRSLRATRSSEAETSANADPDLSTTSWNLVDHKVNAAGSEDLEVTLRRPEGIHLRFDFASGASRFHCRILFSEQFDALRRCCGCEESIITSLARCVKWDSSGGKSGMTFLKTRDDRLVLKQLSSSEMASFSTFAPTYFAHMADCLMHGKPTTLAKIFGLYRISMRNQATGKAYKLDILVMEHLLYGRTCSRIFDLKGSMRNRYVKETGAAGEVLLDENLAEISLRQPLFIREASKAMLRAALKHDSEFLAQMNIMDYSVIIGVDTSDDENHELVVGIIDFLRSYTWDKRVETFVKEQSSLLGGSTKGELPTVITPKQYANRFLTFLDGILLLSPDAWYSHEGGGGTAGLAAGEGGHQGSAVPLTNANAIAGGTSTQGLDT